MVNVLLSLSPWLIGLPIPWLNLSGRLMSQTPLHYSYLTWWMVCPPSSIIPHVLHDGSLTDGFPWSQSVWHQHQVNSIYMPTNNPMSSQAGWSGPAWFTGIFSGIFGGIHGTDQRSEYEPCRKPRDAIVLLQAPHSTDPSQASVLTFDTTIHFSVISHSHQTHVHRGVELGSVQWTAGKSKSISLGLFIGSFVFLHLWDFMRRRQGHKEAGINNENGN